MAHITDAPAALGPPGLPIEEAETTTPDRPGLYAIYANSETWQTYAAVVPSANRTCPVLVQFGLVCSTADHPRTMAELASG